MDDDVLITVDPKLCFIKHAFPESVARDGKTFCFRRLNKGVRCKTDIKWRVDVCRRRDVWRNRAIDDYVLLAAATGSKS